MKTITMIKSLTRALKYIHIVPLCDGFMYLNPASLVGMVGSVLAIVPASYTTTVREFEPYITGSPKESLICMLNKCFG